MFIKEAIMIGSIGDSIFEEAFKEGYKKGVERATVYCIRSLMEKMDMTSDEAMSVLEVSKDEYEKYKDLLEHSKVETYEELFRRVK